MIDRTQGARTIYKSRDHLGTIGQPVDDYAEVTHHIPIDAIKAICQRHRVRELAIFGSALRSDCRPDSDVDLLVDFESDAEVGFLEFAALQNELSDLLHRKVDLVPKQGLKHLIRDDILISAQIIYAA